MEIIEAQQNTENFQGLTVCIMYQQTSPNPSTVPSAVPPAVPLNLVSSRTPSSSLIYIPAIYNGIKMASNASCFAPDDTLVTTWSPCNSTEDGRVSACCELSSSVCTTTGLCVGSAEYFYRAGCTDPSWRSPSCPSQCVTGKPLSLI